MKLENDVALKERGEVVVALLDHLFHGLVDDDENDEGDDKDENKNKIRMSYSYLFIWMCPGGVIR